MVGLGASVIGLQARAHLRSLPRFPPRLRAPLRCCGAVASRPPALSPAARKSLTLPCAHTHIAPVTNPCRVFVPCNARIQATTGLLFAKTLSVAAQNPYLSGGAYNPVLALDIFLVQVRIRTDIRGL